MKELIKQHAGFHQDENFVPTKCLKRVCISNMPYDRIARFSIKTLLYNTILWIILIAIIPLDHRGMIYQFCGNKIHLFSGIPLVGATMSTTMTCTGSTSFVNEIAKSSFVSARNSPSPVKFKFLRRSYVPYLPLKVIITTDNGPNITSFFLQAHEQRKTTPIGNFNSTFSDKDISIIGCGVNTVKFKNTATTETGKYRKRSKVTLYWNPPANFKTAIQFRVNVFTTDRPTRGWRGITSEEIVPRVAECYTGNGASYRGTMSHTKSGIYCQKWDSQTPHTHIFSRNRRQFADKGLESDFCRKPDTDNIPWCYTTAQRPVFEACDIPKCTNGGLPKHFAEFGETVGDKKVSRKFGEIGRIKFSANFSMVKANYTNAAVFENGVIVLGKDEDSIKNIKLAKNKGLTFTSNTESKSGSTAVIAPFWTEIHRNQSIGSNYVFFRESTEPDVMIPLGDDVTSKLRFLNRKKPRDEMFVPKWALIVTWYLVGGNSSVTDVKNLNSFQAILTTDGNRSFVLLNYDMRKWSEKKNTALIGYKSGNAMSFLNHSLPYTKILQFQTASRLGRAVTTQSNVGKAGQMMYEISICNKLLPDGSKPKKCSDSLTLRLKAAPSPPTNCQGKNCTGNRTCDSKTGDCVCPAGYTGSQCEINIDDCQQNPCQNGGTCTDATNGYYCTCRPGYTGSRCEANVNECFKSPCLNNGTCVDGENSYRCICTPEYKGVNCETLKDQCKSNPCMNGAKCTTTEDNFVCNCAEEFSGEQCQYRYCFDGSCIKSHTCQDRTTGKENCTCRADAPSNGYCQEVPSLPDVTPRQNTVKYQQTNGGQKDTQTHHTSFHSLNVNTTTYVKSLLASTLYHFIEYTSLVPLATTYHPISVESQTTSNVFETSADSQDGEFSTIIAKVSENTTVPMSMLTEGLKMSQVHEDTSPTDANEASSNTEAVRRLDANLTSTFSLPLDDTTRVSDLASSDTSLPKTGGSFVATSKSKEINSTRTVTVSPTFQFSSYDAPTQQNNTGVTYSSKDSSIDWQSRKYFSKNSLQKSLSILKSEPVTTKTLINKTHSNHSTISSDANVALSSTHSFIAFSSIILSRISSVSPFRSSKSPALKFTSKSPPSSHSPIKSSTSESFHSLSSSTSNHNLVTSSTTRSLSPSSPSRVYASSLPGSISVSSSFTSPSQGIVRLVSDSNYTSNDFVSTTSPFITSIIVNNCSSISPNSAPITESTIVNFEETSSTQSTIPSASSIEDSTSQATAFETATRLSLRTSETSTRNDTDATNINVEQTSSRNESPTMESANLSTQTISPNDAPESPTMESVNLSTQSYFPTDAPNTDTVRVLPTNEATTTLVSTNAISTRRETTVTRSTSYKTTGTTEMNSFITSTVIASSNPSVIVEKVSGVPTTVRIEGLEGATSISTTTASTDFDDISSFPNSNKTDNITETTSSYDSTPDASTYFENEQYTSEEPPVTTINGLFTTLPVSTAAQTSPGKSSGTSMQTKMASPVESTTPATVLTSQKTIFLSTDSMDKWMLSTTNSVTQPITTSVASTDATSATITSVGSTTSVGLTTPLTVMTSQDTMLFNTGPGDESILSTTNSITEPITTSSTLSSATSTSATAFTNIVSQSTTTQSDSNTRNESNLAETTVSSTALLTDEITQEVTVTQQVPTSTTSDVTSIDETQTANLEYPSTTISFNEIPSSSVINGIRTPTATSSITEQTSQSTRETTMPTETTIISTTQTSSKAVTQSQQQTTGYTQSIASSTVSEILLNETSTSQNSFVTSATTSTDGIETLTPSGSSAGSNFENSISTDSTATVFEIETTSTNTFQTTETLLATTNVLTETTPNASACSSEKTGTDPSGYILWPTTNSGSVAVSSCPTPTSKTATRVCNSSNWGAPDTSACTQLSPRSRELQDIDRTTIVAGNAATLANQILNVTSNEKDSLVAYDLQLVSNILLKVVNVIGEENNYDITSDVINSVSNVIEAPSEELRVASQEFSSNSRLVQVIDNVLLKLEVLTDQNVYLDSKNVKVAVAGISGNQTFTGKSFTLSSNLQPGISDGTDSGDNSGQASVFIPPSIREKVTSSFTRIQFAVYTSTALFNHVRVDDGTVPGLGSNMNVSVYSDHVVSASVGNTKITGLSENVTITISRSNSYYGKGPHCVFYNFPNNGGEGSWSAEGCHLNPVSTSTTTICDCNHLTNFAVIMDVYGTVEYFNEYQNMILQILTYIGCSLSIFGLLCTLISYLMFEKLRKEVPAKILICLCAALITVNIVYLCLQSAYYSSHTTCVAIAAIMHYALLSSLMWMGLEAINMYIALVKVFNTYYRKYMLKMSLAGWGVPLLIVLIAFIVQFATGIPSYEMNSKTEICWLRKDVFYGTLVAPFAIVFLLNSVIYCLVLAQLLGMSSRKLKHLDSARKLKKPAKRENFRKLRGAIGLMALLGISWGFALGTFDKAALTFAYVFVVFNSSQGFWVFIFHCVLKKEVSKCWKKLIFNKGTFRDGSSRWSRFSSSNTRGSRSTTTSSARSMSASSIRTSYLVPKPSKSVDRSEASIGMDSKGLDVVTRTNSTANPVFDDPDIGPPPPFPPPPIPTEERIVRRVPRRTSPQPSTTISTQTDINLLHSSDTDSQNSMESMENSRQDEQNMEDEERRDSVNNNFGLPGIQGFQFPDHREVVISPSNESGIYSDASVSSTAILVEMPTYMDLESNNNEVSALRNNDVRGHHSGEINLGYEDDTLDDVTIISNDVTLINSGVKDNVDIVERHGGVNSRPHQRYAVKETKSDSTPGTPRIKGTNSLTDDARNTDSGISISSDATGAGSSTAGSTRSDRPELVTQDSRSSLYSVNSNTSSASGPSSGSESSYQIGRVRDRESSGDLPSPHLWKAPLVIKRSDDHTKANKKEGIFRRKPVITGPNNNGSTKRALWKRSRNNSKDNSTEKQSMNSFPPKRKLKRQPNKSENCDKSEGATNKLDIQMTNFSLNRGSFHDGAL
ncbi:uncharacterized protein LOC120337160 isoform X3 [Styela clava]